MRFNSEQVLALAQLEHNRDFGVVLEALRAELETCTDGLLTAVDPVSIHRAQGRAEVLKTILKSAAHARTNAVAAQEQQRAKARSAAGHPGTWTG